MTVFTLFCCCLSAITVGIMWLTHAALMATFGPTDADDE